MVRLVAIATAVAVAISGTALEAQGFTKRISAALDGSESDSVSGAPSLSEDGRLVAFQSYASNLVTGDTNGCADVFVFDGKSGAIRRVSVANGGAQGDHYSGEPAISADGRFLAFRSDATNLVAGDTNGQADVFVHELATGRTWRVSTGPAGAQSNGASGRPAISRDGRHVAFESAASNLVAGDTNGADDVFVRDRDALTTVRASADGSVQGDADSGAPSITHDGKAVAFTSRSASFTREAEMDADVFLYDVRAQKLSLVSADQNGRPAGGENAVISGDGAVVAFESAGQLRSDDLNADRDVYAWRVYGKRMLLASVSTAGQPGRSFTTPPDTGLASRIPAHSGAPSLSTDGRWLVFTSLAGGLVPGDVRGAEVYVRDLDLGVTRCVTADPAGRTGAAPCALDFTLGAIQCPAIVARVCGDATRIGLQTAGVMLAGDANGADDVYLVELAASYEESARAGVEVERQAK